jgi:arginine utilization protein RocB
MSLRGTLESALAYFTDRADADHNGHRFVGNEEAQLAAEIQEELNKTVAATERQEPTITTNPPLPVT